MPMSIEEQYAAAQAFDDAMTPEHKAAFARLARSAWIESGGTEESFRKSFPAATSDIDAVEKESK